jgi:hypothetical protein
MRSKSLCCEIGKKFTLNYGWFTMVSKFQSHPRRIASTINVCCETAPFALQIYILCCTRAQFLLSITISHTLSKTAGDTFHGGEWTVWSKLSKSFQITCSSGHDCCAFSKSHSPTSEERTYVVESLETSKKSRMHHSWFGAVSKAYLSN